MTYIYKEDFKSFNVCLLITGPGPKHLVHPLLSQVYQHEAASEVGNPGHTACQPPRWQPTA